MNRRSFLCSGLTLTIASFFPWAARGAETDLLLLALNDHRQDIGLAPLVPEPALTNMSLEHASYMHKLGRATHKGPGGSDPIERGIRSGYIGRILGEVLAESVEGPLGTLNLWLAHDQTRAVLLDAEAREFGLFCVKDPRRGLAHWDLVLGA